MRALGLDIGSVRVGVAVSDPAGAVASAVSVLDARELARDVRPLARIAEDYDAEVLVVGLPFTLAGEEGPQAADVREVAGRLAGALGLPLVFQDERNSSAEARRSMRAATAGVNSCSVSMWSRRARVWNSTSAEPSPSTCTGNSK